MSNQFSLENVKIALIQMSCVAEGDLNLKKALTQIDKAAGQGAQIICLQELFQSRYFCQSNDKKYFALAEPVPGPTTDILAKKAREKSVVIVASLFEKGGDNKFYNTAIIINSNGEVLTKYRKIHIPDDLPNHYSEMFYFTPGNLGFPVATTQYGKIGALICWDQWFPEAARAMASAGAAIIFYPTAIGWPRNERAEDIGKTEFDAWVTMQRSHAIANGVFVAACNRVGKEDHLQFWGGSFVSNPLGEILKQSPHDHEEILITTCELGHIEDVRKDWPFLTCRRKDSYY